MSSFLILLLASCSPYKQFIRVDPRLADIKNGIDTIAVFSDALVAVSAKKTAFYSDNLSYLLDTLILFGAQEILKGKGYETRQINPLFSGSFMDSFQYVPVRRFNAGKIESARLPTVFQNELSGDRLKAFMRTCRRLYLQTVNTNSNRISLTISNPLIKSDLDTLQNAIKCEFVLFIFHQAKLINPGVTAAMESESGVLVSTGVLGGRPVFGSISFTGVFYTYMILVKLSTGNVVWSNYSDVEAAPIDSLVQMSKKCGASLSGYMKPHIMQNVVWRWREFNLGDFPKKDAQKTFMGYKRKYKYPSENFFHP